MPPGNREKEKITNTLHLWLFYGKTSDIMTGITVRIQISKFDPISPLAFAKNFPPCFACFLFHPVVVIFNFIIIFDKNI